MVKSEIHLEIIRVVTLKAKVLQLSVFSIHTAISYFRTGFCSITYLSIYLSTDKYLKLARQGQTSVMLH